MHERMLGLGQFLLSQQAQPPEAVASTLAVPVAPADGVKLALPLGQIFALQEFLGEPRGCRELEVYVLALAPFLDELEVRPGPVRPIPQRERIVARALDDAHVRRRSLLLPPSLRPLDERLAGLFPVVSEVGWDLVGRDAAVHAVFREQLAPVEPDPDELRGHALCFQRHPTARALVICEAELTHDLREL